LSEHLLLLICIHFNLTQWHSRM